MPHRYFTAEVGNGRAALNGTDAHHLADVMRAKIGENVILCDAHAVEYVGTITSIQPGRVEFTVTEGCPRWSFPYRILTPCATASRTMTSCSSFTSAAVFRCGKFSTKNRETVQNGSPW